MLFKQVQAALAQVIRQPHETTLAEPDARRRLAVYQDLFFNNIMGFVSNGFPVLKSLYSTQDWRALVRQFFVHHSCRTPYFVEISKEFVEFLANEYDMTAADPVFLAELAHYEYIELDVSIRRASLPDDLPPFCTTQLKSGNWHFSPLADVVSYAYPVHQISEGFQPTESTGQYYYLVYRDSQDDVQFMQLNAMTAYLANYMECVTPASFQTVLDHIQVTMPNMELTVLTQGLSETFREWSERHIIYYSDPDTP